MQGLILAGTVVTVAGLAGILWCILEALRARRSGLDEAALRARLQRAVLVNFAALGVAAIGLMMIVLGVVLGR